MKKQIRFVAASALAAAFAIPAHAQGNNQAPAAAVSQGQTAPTEQANGDAATLEALKKQNEFLAKQIEDLKAAAQNTKAPAATPAAPAFENVSGLIGTVHPTTTTFVYGDPHLGQLTETSLKAFTAPGTLLELSRLNENTKSLPPGQPYGFKLQGWMKVTEPGLHGISVSLTASVPEKGVKVGSMIYTADKCATTITIGEGDNRREIGGVGRVGIDRNQTGVAYSVADAKTVDLEPGAYKFEATVHCSGPAYNAGFKTNWTIRVQQPSDFEPVAPPASMFFHKRRVAS